MKMLLAAFVGIPFVAFSQLPSDHFYYVLDPKVVQIGQAVTFQCYKMGPALFGYQTTWVQVPTPISSKKTYILRLKSKRNEAGLTMVGYSGPIVKFELNEPAMYHIEFDSTSDFWEPLGDSAFFEVTRPSSIFGEPVLKSNDLRQWLPVLNRTVRIDGKTISWESKDR